MNKKFFRFGSPCEKLCAPDFPNDDFLRCDSSLNLSFISDPLRLFSNFSLFTYSSDKPRLMACKRDSLHSLLFLSIKHFYGILHRYLMCRYSKYNSHSTTSHNERKTYFSFRFSDQRVMTRRHSKRNSRL